MSWIAMISEEESTGALKKLYQRYTEPWGGVDNILKVESLNPPAMEAHFNLYSTLMRGVSELTRVQREMIAVVVSALNHCDY